MQAIIDFISGIGQLLYAAFDWLISTVLDLAHIAVMLGDMALNIPVYFAWLPSECVAILVAIFAVVVLYKILGREG